MTSDAEAARLAAIRARLTNEEARAAWRANVRAAFDAVMAAKIGDLVDVDAIDRGAAAVLTADVVERALSPLWDRALVLASDELAQNQARAGDYVPAPARQRLDRLMEHPKLVDERLLRVMLEHEAAHEVLREVLFDALKEFNERVNPFFADWGLPSLLKRLGPFGLGAMGKSFDALRAEFDRRLEPEIRKFLVGFSRRATKKMADYVVDKIDTPTFVALRKQLAARLLEERLAEIVRPARDERAALGRRLLVELAAHVVARPEARAALKRLVEQWKGAHSTQTLRDAFASAGVTALPDVEALADATWPLLKAALSTDAILRWLAAAA